MSAFVRSTLLGAVVLFIAAPALAQTNIATPINYQVNMSGPRFGLTMLSNGNIAKLKENDITVRPLISQFGWQFEKQVYNGGGNGFAILSEWIPVIGGMDQGYFLPRSTGSSAHARRPAPSSGSDRTSRRWAWDWSLPEGVTVRSGGVNIPLNFAVASSKSGVRVSIMTGFNVRK